MQPLHQQPQQQQAHGLGHMQHQQQQAQQTQGLLHGQPHMPANSHPPEQTVRGGGLMQGLQQGLAAALSSPLQQHRPNKAYRGLHPTAVIPQIAPTTVPEGAKIFTELPNIIHLNVGGVRLMTTLQTLRADPNSMLARMFSGEHPVLRDEDGSFVIDRDGRHFYHIINFLRDGTPPLGLNRSDRVELLREADFYGLRSLFHILAGPLLSVCNASGGGPGAFLQSLTYDLARAEAIDFTTIPRSHRLYARLRYGGEYSGDWIVSSPRNLPGVEYELYDACLARDPVSAMNKMGGAGFLPCQHPPIIPPSSQCHCDNWEILMYKDIPL
eukprot:gnl/TRDRNA2_/TRDRNA2_157183_c2_seq1.p1 gnl/TRDRNA2_/TRDRNA2_157183_c2~~gnl/TRDRNA2_/TRDRNA2_157183_c2_seq1.p1  ORF type:complete len:326 (-),score=30.70 gnl/TRDRNA2_/TRDRNA2_157183_c2_seq1:115-1092(-)